MEMIVNDGGRSKYFKGTASDCAVRAICNATGKDYKEVYDAINELAKHERTGKRKKGISSAREGVYGDTFKKYVEGQLGWVWHPTMKIGSGCKVHLCAEELPKGILIVSISRHYTCVKDGVIYDTWNCSIDKYVDWNTGKYMEVTDKRCVYGYWTKE